MKLVGLLLDDFSPYELSRVQSVELESKSPSFRIFIISFEYAAASEMLPLIHWLLDDLDVEE